MSIYVLILTLVGSVYYGMLRTTNDLAEVCNAQPISESCEMQNKETKTGTQHQEPKIEEAKETEPQKWEFEYPEPLRSKLLVADPSSTGSVEAQIF